MISLQRHLYRNYKQLRSFTSSSALSSKKESDNGNDDKKQSKDEVSAKLNDLLNMMIQKDNDKPKKVIQLAQAVKRKREKKERPEKEKPLGDKLASAAKEVATSLGGDEGKTESELLNILLRRTEPSTSVLKDVLTGIKVEKESGEVESRAQQVRDSPVRADPLSVSARMKLEMRKPQKGTAAQVNILGAEPTSFFVGLQPEQPTCRLQTWTACEARDIRLAVTHPPSNIYEQMIQWTDRHMLWRFPIDNEQDLDKEKQVSFEEHIFLETHLEGWCPETGPIRHFMELVCVGLSKNYWLTVEEKKNHIMWFRDYFADKKTLIKEIGAGTIDIEATERKEITA